MKVIVAHEPHASSYLRQYASHIECMSEHYKILDIEEKHLPWLNDLVQYVEPNFLIRLCGEVEPINVSLVDDKNIILAYIGKNKFKYPADVYYNIEKCTLKKMFRKEPLGQCERISCYSETNIIDAISYIKCIYNLSHYANEMNKPIIIYADIYVPHETFRYRALTYKIINQYIATENGALFIKCPTQEIYKHYEATQKPFECYADHTIYLDLCLGDALKKSLPLLQNPEGSMRFKDIYKCYRQTGTLYNDIFYQSIRPEEEIYVLLNSGNYRRPEYYMELGLQAIRVVDDYSVLYGRKSQFDALSEVLREEVAPHYDMPIVSHIFCFRNLIDQKSAYSLAPDNLQYRGRGVYIGVITVDAVDYTSNALRLNNGESRIACIWDQIQAGEGVYYFKEQINAALGEADPGTVIPLPQEDSMSTMMLALAGGEDPAVNFSGVATEAEFIVAKINPAPYGIQSIYGGTPSIHGVTMPDVLIGVNRLIDFARVQRRPLVLCVPFNGNIDAHDGSYTLNQILGFLAQRTSLTIIAPTGEEADKQHHYGLAGPQEPLRIVNVRVDKEEQNIVGVIYYRLANIINAYLYPPQNVLAEPVDLTRAVVSRINEASIYSNGQQIDFQNGARDILFRIDTPQVGGWRIELTLETSALSQIDIWVAQQELNPHTTLRPSDPFMTVGSTANSIPLMSVGGFDRDSMVVLRSSGRGYSWDDRVQPFFVTHGNNVIAPCRINEWVSISGTLPAASVILGVVATLYSKFIEEQFSPLPNTQVMNGIMLRHVEQFQGVEYPNPSQGYGIFNINTLRGMLGTPLI
ncbi:hypothetical protein [Cellulosilyticum sp. I15G10I2]|uniref:hypothetical protein n=1 Tax=Cellulosilyticum sp. I15G10I2 TaxID=1892843 RepID=UPI00085BB4B9|nr:hypothetical protein [Cellulosilyticum sp. I15G10I2]